MYVDKKNKYLAVVPMNKMGPASEGALLQIDSVRIPLGRTVYIFSSMKAFLHESPMFNFKTIRMACFWSLKFRSNLFMAQLPQSIIL